MSRSRKKAIDQGGSHLKKQYHKRVRSSVNRVIRESKKLEDTNELEIPDAKVIVNDYDYNDYKCDMEHDNNPRWAEIKTKMRRK